MVTASAPDVAEVDHVSAIASPVIRNLRITYCYSRLAAAVADRCGTGANWCTFATWASRQAGRTIRGEDLFADVDRHLARRADLLHPVEGLWRALLRRGLLQPETRLGRLTAELHTPLDAVERASDAVARGNRKVFEEIGREFARYLAECPPDAPPGSPELERFLAELRPGEPPDGQRLLRQAFARYDRARTEADARARAELILLANLEIGLHEQTRLEPEIREAMDAAWAANEDFGRRAVRRLFPRLERWRPVHGAAAKALAHAASGLQRVSGEVARDVITHSFMVLSLPGRVLALGANLVDPFPDDLRRPLSPDLIELLSAYEPAAPEPDDCGARDWAELRQRMHYIIHLFRAFHETATLRDPPFTPEQVAAFSRGVVPAGDL